jgi:hypothetical protein
MHLKPYAKDKFFFENAAVTGEFKRGASGNIISLDMVSKRGISSTVLKKTDKPIPARP